MNWTRAELKRQGNEQIGRQYWSYVLVDFLYSLLAGGMIFNTNFYSDVLDESSSLLFGILMCISLFSVMIGIFAGNPFYIGMIQFYLTGMYTKAPLSLIGNGFQKETYWKIVRSMVLYRVYIALWSLLFVIPGVIKSYEYYFVPYIIAERPGISTKEAIQISKRMTKGEKWNIFVLELSFLGWILVGVFVCCGIGSYFISPYINATKVQLYEQLKIVSAEE